MIRRIGPSRHDQSSNPASPTERVPAALLTQVLILGLLLRRSASPPAAAPSSLREQGRARPTRSRSSSAIKCWLRLCCDARHADRRNLHLLSQSLLAAWTVVRCAEKLNGKRYGPLGRVRVRQGRRARTGFSVRLQRRSRDHARAIPAVERANNRNPAAWLQIVDQDGRGDEVLPLGE